MKMPQNPLKIAGLVQEMLYKLPAGPPCIRGINKALARVAFYAPAMGAEKGHDIAQVRDGWLAFLSRAGITPVITSQDNDSFHWEVGSCPYGYHGVDQLGVCDAVMDLDRAFTRLLGGEMTILSRIPEGSPKCRFVTRFLG